MAKLEEISAIPESNRDLGIQASYSSLAILREIEEEEKWVEGVFSELRLGPGIEKRNGNELVNVKGEGSCSAIGTKKSKGGFDFEVEYSHQGG